MRFHVILAAILLSPIMASESAVAADALVATVPEALVPVREAAAGDADKTGQKQNGEKKAADGKETGRDKGKSNQKENEKEKPPACVHCGATCGLEAVCVCECGTKKKTKTEYEAKCDPICVPRCSGLPWPFSRCRHDGGCTDCQPDACRAWVRQRKTLVKETKDEEVSVIERKVQYVCCTCAGRGKAGCCGGEPVEPSCWWLRWLPGCGTP
jgi:hypothetical protein